MTIASPVAGEVLSGPFAVTVALGRALPTHYVVHVFADSADIAQIRPESRTVVVTPERDSGPMVIRAVALDAAGDAASGFSDRVSVTWIAPLLPALRLCAETCDDVDRLDVVAGPDGTVAAAAFAVYTPWDAAQVVRWTLELDGEALGEASYEGSIVAEPGAWPEGEHALVATVYTADGRSASVQATAVVAPCDADADGSLRAGCGAGPWDCDDANPVVAPGAVDVCDGLDNDCNGVVDDAATSGCAEGQRCEEGVCATVCTFAGQACTGVEAATAAFLCDLVAGACRTRCALEPYDATECVAEDAYCAPVGDGGACVPVACSGALDDGCGAGRACVPWSSAGGACAAEGPAAEGEVCDATMIAPGTEALSCGAGLWCIAGRCARLCALDAAEPACGPPDDTCLRALPAGPVAGAGVCAAPCAPYSRATCDGGGRCVPYVSALQDAFFVCRDGADAVAIGARCEMGASECVEGSVCHDDGGGQTRCAPLCDPTGAWPDAPYAACDDGLRCVGDIVGACVSEP